MTRRPFAGLIRTIHSDDEVEYYSEDSTDDELEFQPMKGKPTTKSGFNPVSKLFESVDDYNRDTWNDIMNPENRKAETNTDDKIAEKKRKFAQLSDSEDELSESEFVPDIIRNKNQQKKKLFEPAQTTIADAYTFYDMNLSRPLLKAINSMNYVHPTPIQRATIPVALLGKDICGCAATGTGKTAAYMLPILERLIYRPEPQTPVTRVLVVLPTRELAVQVHQVTKQLCQFTNIQCGLAVGGLNLKAQEVILRKSPDIVIATPGRLIDHLQNTPSFTLSFIEILVLDEADRMLDDYFAEQMKNIVPQCSQTHQTILFSATMTDAVKDLAAVSLKNPVRIFVDSNTQVALNLHQEFVRIRNESDREAMLAALVCRAFRGYSTIIFVQTKMQAHRLRIVLGLLSNSSKVAELHGDLTQLQRLDSLTKFKERQVNILVATNVAARGLDIEGVQVVINFVLPATLEHYIHRVGRTARAGRRGVAISLAGEQERKIVKEILKKATADIKSRVIPAKIIEKYKSKLLVLEDEVKTIIQKEVAERLLANAENKKDRVTRKLEGGGEDKSKRELFQTNGKQLAAGISLKGDKNRKDKGKQKKKKKVERTNLAAERAYKELQRVIQMQVRIAKRKLRQSKTKACPDDKQVPATKPKKKKSLFSDNLTDTSNNKYDKFYMQKLLHEAKKFKKVKRKPHKNFKSSKSKPKKTGKVYGRPQSKKQR